MTLDPTIANPMGSSIANRTIRHVFVRNLVLNAFVGIYKREREARQPVRINVDLAVQDPGPGAYSDQLADVVCYEDVVTHIRHIIERGHVNLIETLADRIAERCLENDRVYGARVRVEKLEALDDVESVGIEIERVKH